MSDLVKLYNPANAAALTSEQVEGLRNLTSEEIKTLAKAYPNMIMQRAFLLIIDSRSKVKNPLPTLSTFENLWNLREKNGLRSYIAIGFRGQVQQKIGVVKPKNSQVIDLSDEELMSLPGVRVMKDNVQTEIIPPTEVKVIKVKKQKLTKPQ